MSTFGFPWDSSDPVYVFIIYALQSICRIPMYSNPKSEKFPVYSLHGIQSHWVTVIEYKTLQFYFLCAVKFTFRLVI